MRWQRWDMRLKMCFCRGVFDMKKMKNTVFSLGLYLQGLKKIRAVGIAAAVCVLFFNGAVPISQMMHPTHPSVTSQNFAPWGSVMMGFAPLLVYSMFSYLNQRSKSDFYLALPQKRVCVFISFSAAILTWILGILGTSALVNTLLWNSMPECIFPVSDALFALFSHLVVWILLAGLMAVAVCLTGRGISAFLVFLLITLFFNTMGSVVVRSLESTVPIVSFSDSWIRFFTMKYFLPFQVFALSFSLPDSLGLTLGWLCFCLVLGVLLFVLAGWFYKRRRSEIAGQSAPNKYLQTLFRSAVTLPFLLPLIFPIVLGETDAFTIVISLLGALLVFFLFELVTTKKLKAAVRCLPQFYVPLLAIAVFAGSLYVTSYHFRASLPTAEDVKSVSVIWPETNSKWGSYEKLQASEISVSSPEAHRLICETLERNMDKNADSDGLYRSLEVRMKLKSGREILRKILISSKDDLDTLENSLLECDAYAQAIMQLPDAQDIQSLVIEKEYYDSIPVPTEVVWESFVSEYNEMSRGEKILYKRNCLSGIPPEHYDGAIKITVFGEDYTSHYFVLSKYMPKTGKLLKSYMR